MIEAWETQPAVIVSLGALLAIVACARDSNPRRQRLAYPESPREEQVDDYHGSQVADPYRWLEELDAQRTAEWVNDQNALSGPLLADLPLRAHFETRLTELSDYDRIGLPRRFGDRLFWERNDGLQDQYELVVVDGGGRPRVLLDPNGFSSDATIALAGWQPSPDGSLIAFARSDGGSDWRDWHVRDVATGTDLDEVLTHIKFTPISWLPDSSGFYYSRYPLAHSGVADGSREVSVYFHRIGSPQTEDEIVFSQPEHPQTNPYATVTEDGRYLVLRLSDGYLKNAVWFRDLDPGSAADFEPLLDNWDSVYHFLGNEGSTFFFETVLDAPNGRVVALDVDSDDRTLREIVPMTEHALQSSSLVGGAIFAEYLVDVVSRVEIWDLSGQRRDELDLPGPGSVGGLGGRNDQTETYYSFESITRPRTTYRYDFASGTSEAFHEPVLPVDAARFETRQVFFESRDGTRVPMFVAHRSDLDPELPHPTMLYGYGGFNVALGPSFMASRLMWMEQGGVYAIANLRGGGEYGKQWHLAGARHNKQNVFDDFIAAAEWLISSGTTTPEQLAISGGSNGGLLVAAGMIQRPDLFAAVLPAVGVLDMLRYHLPSHNARNWADDYGLSENEDDFRSQIAYSPLHNLEDGACYPPTLITTADHDDRVVPWHSYKFAAAAQHAQGCERPVLLSVETRAGHGAGKPMWMQIEDAARRHAFAAEATGMAPLRDHP
ncbi:MAG: prolyl oligopeptidase family serine peptidase [Acidobacteriota bacterium]|nr:prolyl oligopeptidase family serine peptidase [Acidobacteriota bacterium]